MLGLSLCEHLQLPVTSLTRLLWEEHRDLPHSLDTVPNIPTTTRPRAKPQTLEASWSVLVNGVHQCFVPIFIHSVTMKNGEESERDSLLLWPYDLYVILSESYCPCICSLIWERRGLNWVTFVVVLGSEHSSHLTSLPPPLQVGAQSVGLLVFIISS